MKFAAENPTPYICSMKKWSLLFLLSIFFQQLLFSQLRREDIFSEFVLYNKRERLSKDLRENIVARTFAQQLDSNNEHRFESACKAISQFMITGEDVQKGFDQMFAQYNILPYPTKRAFLEAVYGVYPNEYAQQMRIILEQETDPKLFAMSAVYLYRIDSSTLNTNNIKIRMIERFPSYDSIYLLIELEKYLNHHYKKLRTQTPDISQLFDHQKTHGKKIIYSFQRWNRDYGGLAIVQNADGRFMRNESGRLLVFQQLARSASNPPCFIHRIVISPGGGHEKLIQVN